jgi:hypothetical protein
MMPVTAARGSGSGKWLVAPSDVDYSFSQIMNTTFKLSGLQTVYLISVGCKEHLWVRDYVVHITRWFRRVACAGQCQNYLDMATESSQGEKHVLDLTN